MGRWAATDGTDEVFVVVSKPDGTVSLDIPSSPLVVSREQAEKIRILIGAAIADTSPGRSS
jgi:hypothetical protein